MADVLVTGGTGILGRRLAPRLLSRGHRVRLLSRHPGRAAEGTGAGASAGTEAARGDVRTGEGLRAAFAGIDTVIHAATNSRARTRSTEVEGTRNVLEQAKASDAHLIYISIVGVDRHRLPYYRAKWEAERLIASSSAGWTIQRATQFHPLLDMLLGLPAFISTPNLAFQTVDAGEVSDRLADLVEAGPSGRIPDFGGPEILGNRPARRDATRAHRPAGPADPGPASRSVEGLRSRTAPGSGSPRRPDHVGAVARLSGDLASIGPRRSSSASPITPPANASAAITHDASRYACRAWIGESGVRAARSAPRRRSRARSGGAC